MHDRDRLRSGPRTMYLTRARFRALSVPTRVRTALNESTNRAKTVPQCLFLRGVSADLQHV